MHSRLSKFVRSTGAILALGVLLATAARAGDTVNLRFSWKLKGEYAPLFVAREKGYFAEQGN